MINVEQGVRLSRCRLWQWQRRYFAQKGAAAWQQGTVPHYVTSNAFIADAYARVVLGFLRDLGQGVDSGAVDPSQPLYIVELGAGVGRFAYHFLSRLQERLARCPLRVPPIKYVVTDLSPSNVEYYLAHPLLRPLLDSGHLDCADFDLEGDDQLHLRRSGAVLAPGQVRNPVVFIANYVFDGVPHDAFRMAAGALQECPVTLQVAGPVSDVDDPALIEHAELVYGARPLEFPYYEDPLWDRILSSYAARGGDGEFLFPCAALQALLRLRALAGDRLLLLTADKGHHDLEDVCVRQHGMALHGSFSFSVNYHAIAEYVRAQGGQALQLAHRHASLSLNAFLFGAEQRANTELAFADSLASGGPDDLFLIKKAVDQRYETLTLEQLLGLLRLCCFDHKIFLGALPAIRRQLGAARADAGLRADLQAAVERVLQSYFPIGEEVDLEAASRELLHELSQPAAAAPSRLCRPRFATLAIHPARPS